jgi:glutamine synthetase
MRNDGGIEAIKTAINKFANKHNEHMAVYGEGNNRRLTGIHETSDINTFTYGDCDRSSSIRIPINVKIEGKGYLEDRRPASNIDPYLVCARIIKTICTE